MAKKETAEQKLLKIIEATRKAQEGSTASAAPSAAKPSAGVSLSISQINYGLMAALVASLVYCLYEVNQGMNGLGQDVEISDVAGTPGKTLNNLTPRMKAAAYYLDQIRSRNIFQPYEVKAAAEQGATGARAVLEQTMQKYKLVGVAWLDVPESATVMLESTAEGTTRFLREGDKIDGVTVKTIYTDRVVVGHENEEMVIKL